MLNGADFVSCSQASNTFTPKQNTGFSV